MYYTVSDMKIEEVPDEFVHSIVVNYRTFFTDLICQVNLDHVIFESNEDESMKYYWKNRSDAVEEAKTVRKITIDQMKKDIESNLDEIQELREKILELEQMEF